MKNYMYAVISKGVIDNKRADFAYRADSCGNLDSGWRIFSDRNDDSEEFYLVSLNTLRKWWYDTSTFMNEKPFTVVERIRDGYVARSRKDKELKAVPEKKRKAKDIYCGVPKYRGEAPHKKGLGDALWSPKQSTAVGFVATDLKLALVPYEEECKTNIEK